MGVLWEKRVLMLLKMEFESSRNRVECVNIFTNWDEEYSSPISSFPGGVEGIVDMFLDEGGIIIGKSESSPVGILGYTLGVPADKFVDKKVGYVYIAVVPKKYRSDHTFFRLAKRTIDEMDKEGVEEIRFKSSKFNYYNNRLYGKFASVIGDDRNSQGVPSWIYSANLKDVKQQYFR